MQNRYSGLVAMRNTSRLAIWKMICVVLIYFSIMALIPGRKPFYFLHRNGFHFKCLQVKLSGCFRCLPSGVCAKVFHVSHFEFHFFIECRNKGVDFFSHSEVFQEIFAHIESHPHIIQSGDIHNRSTGADQLAHFGEYFGHFTVGSSCEDGLIHVGRYLGNCSFGTFHLCGGSCFVFLLGAILSHFVL